MFCHNCGKEIENNVSFCSYCGAKIFEEGKHGTVDLKNEQKQLKKKRNYKWMFLLIGSICMVTIGVILANQFFLTQEKDYAGIFVSECYIPNENNIIYEDQEKSLGYVNNMIHIFFSMEATNAEIEEVVDSINGEVVGQIVGINQYQVEIEASDKAELEKICKELLIYDVVHYAIIDQVVSMESNEVTIPNDPWKDTFQGLSGVSWDEEKPEGTNWWIEATNVLFAWNYDEYFSTINVGVVDNGFDTNHEDLEITVLNENVNLAEDHGTHVAGIIGATTSNEKGISGILNHVNLYGVDWILTSEQEEYNTAISSLMNGISKCLDKHCKVINLSMGEKFNVFSNLDTVQNTARFTAQAAALYMLFMLKYCEEDFIIVQSAGNGNELIGYDASFNGYFSAVTEEVVRSAINELEENDRSIFGTIPIQDVLDSIIIVGNVDINQKNEQYQLARNSNYGNTITVCAPGVDIFSTVVSGGVNGSYDYLSGTSMATPIVSGITAMVWSVDQTMSSAEVKEIICSTALKHVQSRNKDDSGTYYMIDAKAAVEKAVRQLDAVEQWNVTPESKIYVYDKNKKFAKDYTVTVSCVDLENMPQGPNIDAPKKDIKTYTVSEAEPFRILLTAGVYEILIKKEDCEEQYTYYATVSEDGESEHSVYTEFASSSALAEEINSELTLQVGTYQYSLGEFLAELRVTEVDGEKKCYWGEWTNYGDSASIEDFEFTWEDGKFIYEVVGWRSGQLLNVQIELNGESIVVEIANTEGLMYFDNGSEDRTFKAEYKLKNGTTSENVITSETEQVTAICTLKLDDEGVLYEVTLKAQNDHIQTLIQVTNIDLSVWPKAEVDLLDENIEHYQSIYDKYEGADYEAEIKDNNTFYEKIVIDMRNEETVEGLQNSNVLPLVGDAGKISLEKTVKNLRSNGWDIDIKRE